ncbi:phage head closure protein [Virgibacillus sp. M23]|uniref:phage head closure protein n=1 Tax=Virgibacillus sp. M23 TaxID=3079030 RepID=UPI002A91C37D|nr:phage head closure protein [Virgibacillus sp. M23]MDY7044039.1 phage head closure protein [Virgibacillus sp. M23]
MKPINPGELRHRLIFQQPAGGTDEDGFPINEPTLYTKAWAKLKTLKGNAFYTAAQSQMEHNRQFTIRYQRKLEDNQRPKGLTVLWRNVEHEIESIEDDDGLRISMTVVLKAVS